jgi:hypothetical protein
MLIDRKWHSSIVDVQSFRGADSNTDHCLVVGIVRDRLAVSKQAAQKFDGERFNVRTLNELKVRNKYQIEISNRFAALENLNDCKNIHRAWENIKENIKISVKERLCRHELMQHKSWFIEKYLSFLDQRNQAKMQLVEDPSQSNVDNLNNVRHDASRHFRNTKMEKLKDTIEKPETNSKIKKY